MAETKKLMYPKIQVDDRLSAAHSHTNKNFLDKLKDEEALKAITNTFSASIDLSNVSKTTLDNALKNSSYGMRDATCDNRIYGRRNGSWVEITDIKGAADINSDTLTITKNSSSTTINLSDDTKQKLDSITDKMNVVTSGVADNLLCCSGTTGQAKCSSININNLLTKSSVKRSLENDSNNPVAASVVYKLASDLGLLGDTTGKSLVSRIAELEKWKEDMDNKTFVTIS